MKNKKIQLLLHLIPLLLIINMIIRWRFATTISPDTYSYFEIAKTLPYVDNSTFPIGYPIFLKSINYLFDNYLISYKILAFLCLAFSLIFVRINNFYWREIWVLFTFSSFLRMAPYGLSETLLIPLLILVFYYNFQFLNNKILKQKFIIFYPILLFSCVLIKYSSLFFIVANFIFGVYLRFIKDEKQWTYLKVSIISAILSGLYLINNYWITGFTMGERFPPSEEHLDISVSLLQILYSLNPLYYDNGIGKNLYISLISSIVFGIVFLYIILRFLYKNKDTMEHKMIIFNILNSILFLIGTLYSYFTVTIDNLGYRLLLGYYIFLFFAVIIALSKFRSKAIL